MKVAILQSSLFWENPDKNIKHFKQQIYLITESIDLIVLPEMFTSGFTMQPNVVSETMQGKTISWLKEVAISRSCAITGSLVIEENNTFYNRMVFVFPSGEIEYYDKRHLFTLAGEHKVYTSGNEKKIVTYNGWKICLQICYDLRFPVFARNLEDYDLLLYVANWPKPRVSAWDILLKARAVENMSYTIGVNRTGTDNNNHHYVGHSQIIDCFGNFVIEPLEIEGVFIADLDKDSQDQTRKKLNFLNDRDNFILQG
jgi:omega-amidase